MNRYLLLLAFASGCVTKDCGGWSGVNSEDAEQQLAREGVTAQCIVDNDTDDQFLCSDAKAERLFRCAKTTRSKSKVMCIPWFPTE